MFGVFYLGQPYLGQAPDYPPVIYTATHKYVAVVPREQRRAVVPFENRRAVVPRQPRTSGEVT